MFNKKRSRFRGSLAGASDEQVREMTRYLLVKKLMLEKHQINRPVVYQTLKKCYHEFIQFYVNSPEYLSSLLPEDNDKEFQQSLLSSSWKATFLLPSLEPQTIIDMCLHPAVKWDKVPEMFSKNSKPEKHERILNTVFKKKPQYIVRPGFRSLELSEKNYITAVTQLSWLITQIPKERRTPPVVDACLTTGGALQMLDQCERTPERCKKAVCLAAGAMEFVPDELKTKELCGIAISKSYSALKFIPKSKQTPALKLKALIKNKNAQRYFKT